jgi:hypothetical protein
MVLVHTHTGEPCSNATEVMTLSQTDDKPKWRCSEYPSRSQIATVIAMTITTDNLLSRLKLNSNRVYNVTVKGASVVVKSQGGSDRPDSSSALFLSSLPIFLLQLDAHQDGHYQ